VALYRDERLWAQLRLAALERLARENDPSAYSESVSAVLRAQMRYN
jgi:hypothetical protein